MVETPTGGQANIMGVLVQTLVALLDALLGASPCQWLTMEPDLSSEKFDLVWKAADGVHAIQVKHSINAFSFAAAKKLTAEMKAKQKEVAPDGHCECKLVLVGQLSPTLARFRKLNGVVIVPLTSNVGFLFEVAALRLGKFLAKEQLPPVAVEHLEDLAAILAWRLQEASSKGETLERSRVVEKLRSWISTKPDSATATRISQIAGQGRLPRTGSLLLGREDEMRLLDDAWNSSTTNVLSFVALGGAGKTTLVKKWLERVEARGNHGAYAIYKYSFYDQGAPQGRISKEGQMSSHHFLREALRFFHDENADDETSLENKGERLAGLIQRHRVLLFLDGLETLQLRAGQSPGRLLDQGVGRLLTLLADHNPGLCVITTRLVISDLEGHSRVRQDALARLSTQTGCELLTRLGVNSDAGIGAIQKAVEEYEGHALALTLLGEYLTEYHQGNIARRDRIPLLAHAPKDGGHARRVMESYEKVLEGRPALALLYILGLFDRPASAEAINAVIDPARFRPLNSERHLLAGIKSLNSNSLAGLHNDFSANEEPAAERLARSQQRNIRLRIATTNLWRKAMSGLAIRRMTLPLRHLTQLELEQAIYELRRLRLVEQRDSSDPSTIDCHPFVRMHFGDALRRRNRFVWQEAHSRLFDHYQSVARDLPETISEMEPLYAAVAHGCQAKRYLEAGLGVYLPRMLRGAVFSANTLGLLARDLAVLTYFFDAPWEKPASGLLAQERASIQYWAGTLLATLGRYSEGIKALTAAKELQVETHDWAAVANSSRYLGFLHTIFGNLTKAHEEAEESVRHASQLKDPSWQVGTRSTLGYCLHQLGAIREAKEQFAAAEEALKRAAPDLGALHSVWGYWYCELLLDLGEFDEAKRRGEQALHWAPEQRTLAMGKLLDTAVAELTIARASLSIERRNPSAGFRESKTFLRRATESIRSVDHQWLMLPALLARAECLLLNGEFEPAATDLLQTAALADSNGLRLYEVDHRIGSTELSLRQGNLALAREHLGVAEKRAHDIGYHRRDVHILLAQARCDRLAGNLDDTRHRLVKAAETAKMISCYEWLVDATRGELLS